MVITALTRNQVYPQGYRGFESHPVRHKSTEIYLILVSFRTFMYRILPPHPRNELRESDVFATFLESCDFGRRKTVEILCPRSPLVIQTRGDEAGLALRGDVEMGVNIRRCAEG